MKKCHHENVVRLLEVIDDESNKKIFLSKWNNHNPEPLHLTPLTISSGAYAGR
jgi:hypothetical protein